MGGPILKTGSGRAERRQDINLDLTGQTDFRKSPLLEHDARELERELNAQVS